ncbi:hypothetical protein Mapa_008666 [Marchantia paleacea]|nr:hypothetical protein Mapa_008666 [Marchantia paleacea]
MRILHGVKDVYSSIHPSLQTRIPHAQISIVSTFAFSAAFLDRSLYEMGCETERGLCFRFVLLGIRLMVGSHASNSDCALLVILSTMARCKRVSCAVDSCLPGTPSWGT